MKHYYVYILTNHHNTTLYVGITNDLKRRVFEHKSDVQEGFTRRYQLHKLVYYEITEDARVAIAREKQLKAGSRQKKIDLIVGMNPEWEDLYDTL
jgi:putative endonuclease